MGGVATVILAVNDSSLASGIKSALPDASIIEIDAKMPVDRIEGQLWCFVDFLLPGISGVEVCRRLRLSPVTAHGHITMVLEQDSAETRRLALNAGANDYMAGPLSAGKAAEYLGDLQALSSAAVALPRLAVGDLALDLVSYQVRYRGKSINLAPSEFKLLAHFLKYPDKLFSRSSLATVLGKDCGDMGDRTFNSYVCRLRRNLTVQGVPNPLRTVHSRGFVFDSAVL